MENSRRQLQYLSIALAAILAVVGVLVIALDWHQVRRVASEANWKLAPMVLLFTVISYACLSYRFTIMNRIFGIPMSQRDLTEIGFVSITLNHILSLGAAGYSLRILVMKRSGLAVGDILAASLFDSYLNNLALFLLFPVGLVHLLLSQPLSRGEATGAVLAAVIAILGILIAAAVLVSQPIRLVILRLIAKVWRSLTHHEIPPALGNLDATLARGMAVIRGRPLVLALPLGLIVADWASSIIALGFCFDALGNPISPGVLLTGFVVGVTLGMISMIPGGLGVQDGSMAGIYALLGVPLEQTVLAAALFRIIYYFIPFFVSLGFYRRLVHQMGQAQPGT
ncbi:MAG: flippase-like domain-containing protein [Chloroflexi bacterium]|nr:flippase-like domain-containing protein [Chloroflexota bacterium]